ncbi:MAG: hypothetical protein HUJ94_05680 [Bacteroidales bacterium]|nr:hypothetical protein [Bacteroidales bacterium]
MNIIVVSKAGAVSCRPDTSWEREDNDVYAPGCSASWAYAPITFVRIGKAGKCVGAKFAERYMDGVGFGALLYAADLLDGSADSVAQASCLDHSSIIPFPLYNVITLNNPDNAFQLTLDGNTVFGYSPEGSGQLQDAIVKATERVSVRTGDIVAVELDEVRILCSGPEDHVFSGSFCENCLFTTKLKF